MQAADGAADPPRRRSCRSARTRSSATPAAPSSRTCAQSSTAPSPSSTTALTVTALPDASSAPGRPKDPGAGGSTPGRPTGSTGYTVVVAVPLTEVTSALRRLVLIEGTAGVALLALLAGGAWFLLRRGLRPLEQMATSARSITAGNLSERVTPAEGRTEVGQLGLALNTMLDEIESAFAERDRDRAPAPPVPGRRLPRAAHPAHLDPGIRRAVPPRGSRAERAGVDLPVIMRRIEEESARMKTLVEDLLLLARLDQTRPVERTPVDLAVLAADACSDAVAAAPDRPRRPRRPGAGRRPRRPATTSARRSPTWSPTPCATPRPARRSR